MERDSVDRLARPGSSIADDPLLLAVRDGVLWMLLQVIEAEVEAFLGAHAELEGERKRRRIVQHGHAPEHEIQTGIARSRCAGRRLATAAPTSLTDGRRRRAHLFHL